MYMNLKYLSFMDNNVLKKVPATGETKVIAGRGLAFGRIV